MFYKYVHGGGVFRWAPEPWASKSGILSWNDFQILFMLLSLFINSHDREITRNNVNTGYKNTKKSEIFEGPINWAKLKAITLFSNFVLW